MINPAHISSDKSAKPILIVDKKGIIGRLLARKLGKHFLVVLVSSGGGVSEEKVIHVPFRKKIPEIPDNYYSHMFLIERDGELFHPISSFIKKARNDSSSLILIQSIRASTRKTLEEAKGYSLAKIVFCGDLFSDGLNLGRMDRLLLDIRKERKMVIEGEGLSQIFPVYIDDFIDIVTHEIFVKENKNKILNIFPKSPVTILSLSRMIQAVDPLIRTDFIKKREVENPPYAEQGDFVLPDNYNLKSRIKQVLEKELPQDFKEEPLGRQVGEASFLRGGVFIFILFIIFFLSLPLLTTLGYSGLGLYQLGLIKTNLDKGNLKTSLESAKNSKTSFSFASKTLQPLKAEARIIGKEKELSQIEKRVEAGQSISQACVNMMESAFKIKDILEGKSKNPSSDFSNSLSLLRDSTSEFRRIQAEKKDFPEIAKKIDTLSSGIDLLGSSIDILPQTLGFEREVKYLVLFQNNMELRPGGGFIGSYGILTMRNGQVKDFKINDVYSADGQLVGHVEPPPPIRRYLPQPNWYLRDSNFDLDFTNNATRGAYFLNLETGEKVDGVIALDIDFVKDLLKSIGPVYLSDYKETVDSSNLFKLTEEHSQKDFFPGSTQKKDFLSSLFRTIQSGVNTKKDMPYLSIAKNISNALSQKHLLLVSNNTSVSKTLSANNWSGSIPPEEIPAQGEAIDVFGVSEANLGISKVNYFISRSFSKAQIIDDSGNLSSTVSISYKNDSPALPYKNYLRVILPSDSSLSTISFDNVSTAIVPQITDPAIYESKSFKPPLGVELSQETQSSFKVVGFYVEIAANSLKTISLTYTRTSQVFLSQELKYRLKLIKQPGISSTPFEFSLYFPKNYKTLNIPREAQVSDNKVSITTDLSLDREIDLSFGQK